MQVKCWESQWMSPTETILPKPIGNSLSHYLILQENFLQAQLTLQFHPRGSQNQFKAKSLGIRPVSERRCCDITTHTDRGAAVWRVFKASCGHEKTQPHSVSNQGLIWGGFFFMIWVLSVFWQRYISEP